MENSAKIIIGDSRLMKEVKDEEIDLIGKYIGLQIKPITYEQTPEVYRWKEWLSKTHDKFERDRGGKVFIIFSIKKDGKKVIYNPEVIDEIKKVLDIC